MILPYFQSNKNLGFVLFSVIVPYVVEIPEGTFRPNTPKLSTMISCDVILIPWLIKVISALTVNKEQLVSFLWLYNSWKDFGSVRPSICPF